MDDAAWAHEAVRDLLRKALLCLAAEYMLMARGVK